MNAPPWVFLGLVAAIAGLLANAEPVWVRANEGQTCDKACPLGCLESHQQHLHSLVDAQQALDAASVQCNLIAADFCQPLGALPIDSVEDIVPTLERAAKSCNISNGHVERYFWSVNGQHNLCTLHNLPEDAFNNLPRTCGPKPAPYSSRLCACASFDCAAAVTDIQMGWPERQKKWCCANENISCEHHQSNATLKHDEDFDCNVGRGKWNKVWIKGSHKWCCEPQGVGCLEISNLHGSDARFATGMMELSVGRPHVFATDPAVMIGLRRGIAALMGLDTREVNVRLEVAQESPSGLRSGRNLAVGRVLMKYTAPVPKDSMGNIAVTNGVSEAMILASTSANDWTMALRRGMGGAGYIFSVMFVGEVALSNVEAVPAPRIMAPSKGVVQLFASCIATLLICVTLTAYAAPTAGQDESSNMPGLSPTRSPSRRLLLETFGDAVHFSPRKISSVKATLPLKADEMDTKEPVEEPEPLPRDENGENQNSKKKRCFPGCFSGACGSKRAASEPQVAGPVARI